MALTQILTTDSVSASVVNAKIVDPANIHINTSVDDGEAHGLRVNAVTKSLEYYDGTEWHIVSNGLPVGNVANFTASAGDTKITLNWEDPTDLIVDDVAIAKWEKTKIMRKVGNYPANENDGVLVIENGIRDQYKTTGYEDTGLTNGTQYYYMAFPVTDAGIVTVDTDNRASATPIEIKIYGIEIDENNSNPETAVTYTDNAIGATPMFCNNGTWQMGSWADKFPFNEIKPCLFKNGVVNYYLNPNNYSQKEGGGAADITSGTDGDVMIEFPKIYWKFERVGTKLYVKYSDKQGDSGYKCLAHTVGTSVKDKIYISAYRGYKDGTKLRSLSGKAPTGTQTIGTFRTQAQANGAGYQQIPYYPLLMLQVLALIAGKNRDSQTQLGRGFVDGNSGATNTGQTNDKGLFYGESTGKKQNKFCGIEDCWGNQMCFIDGIFSNDSWNILLSDQTIFNDTGAGYENFGQGATAIVSGYISTVQGGTETGFITKTGGGADNQYYTDHGRLHGGRLAYFGGYYSIGSDAGAFCLLVSQAAGSSSAGCGGRCVYLGV